MVRKANINDEERICELGSLIKENYIELFNIKETLLDSNSKVYVYEDESLILGFLHITELDDLVDIIDIVVDINYRNKGIASLLMDYMFNNTKNSVTAYTLEVSVDNDNAIKLYKKYGFEVVNVRKEYYGSTDAYLMRKEVI